MPNLSAIRRRIYRWRYDHYFSTINHEDVVRHVQSEGRMTSRFSFMVTMSCGIAILGLLLSSPAVVIGAMLISPLMSPIMNLGFSLCLLDPRHFFKSLEAIFLGTVFALAISSCIVHFSPLTDATPEILARTRPNLFDLLVAIFSGLAGCYAVIQRKGETLVGVAIATALMPPLAVVGFGLASWNMDIAGGAFMLFLTNLLAISLSATMLAKWYGFGREHGGAHTIWQSALAIAVLALLSLPLGHALKDITYQAYATRAAKQTLRSTMGEDCRLNLFNITFPKNEPLSIDAVVLTDHYNLVARSEVEKKLADVLSRPVNLRLDQIVLDHEQLEEAKIIPIPETTLQPPPVSAPVAAAPSITQTIREKLFFPLSALDVNEETHHIKIYPSAQHGMSLSSLRQLQSKLQEQYPEWVVAIIPPSQGLPPIFFPMGGTTLTQENKDIIDDLVWALQQWDIHEIDVLGYASTDGQNSRNKKLANARAVTIAKIFKEHGLNTNIRIAYKSPTQKEEERKNGTRYFQRVEIQLPLMLPLNEHQQQLSASDNPTKD